MKIPKMYYIAFALLTLLIVAFVYFNNKGNSLKQYYKVSLGKVVNTNQDAKAGNWCNYEYEVSGKKYSGGIKVYLSDSKCSSFIGKQFPLIYDSTDYSNSLLLIDEEDYIKYGLSIPDSIAQLIE